MNPLEERVTAEIRRRGPLPFDEVMDLALYDPEHGFYGRGGTGAGRRGDFITSPEVGPLFGVLVAAAIDRQWEELGRPDPVVVVDAGAGPGTLARSVLAAEPACGPALRYLAVERAVAQRERHREHLPLEEPSLAFATPRGPVVASLAALPRRPVVGVVLANELLDNLPVRLLERTASGWCEIRVGLDGDERRLVEHAVPAGESDAATAGELAPDAPIGGRVPLQAAAAEWLRSALAVLERGTVIVIDYADTTSSLSRRAPETWLRTYRGHQPGGDPLADLGTKDITTDVAVDQLARVRVPTGERTQAEWLASLGVDDLVDEGRRVWAERAHVGDLEAVRARSRIGEAAALTDPTGLGAFRVLEWSVP